MDKNNKPDKLNVEERLDYLHRLVSSDAGTLIAQCGLLLYMLGRQDSFTYNLVKKYLDSWDAKVNG